MDTLDRESLTSLTREFGFPCVSLYMPTHRAGAEKDQDPIRLRNLANGVSARLNEAGMRSTEAEQFLAPLRSLLEDPGFWRETGDGLAAFLSHSGMTVFRLDTAFPEMISVADRFVIRPLLPAVHAEKLFWLLTLSKHGPRLFDANHESIVEVPLANSPGTFKEAMKYDDADHGFQFHPESTNSPTGEHRGSVYYGGGGLPDAEKGQVDRYVRMVEKAVESAIRGSGRPLLVAGVEYEVSRYRAVNSYQGLLDDALLGNFDEVPIPQLHAAARESLEPYFERKLRADAADLEAKKGSPLVLEDLSQIVTAAHAGRVRTLFVGDTPAGWGRYDPETGDVDVHAEPVPGDWDLAELAVLETLFHGGDVHVLTSTQAREPQVRVETPATILRY